MIRFFITLIWGFYEWYLRPAIKFALRRATGKCELHRLILAYPRGAMRTFAIEQSMRRSKCDLLRGALPWTIHFDYNSRASELARIKNVDISSLSMFSSEFIYSLKQIHAYERLVTETNVLKSTAFDPDNSAHQLLLTQLWNDLAPVEQNADPASRRWSLIGFQTDNPYTDFRGMGILSLKNMVYFSSHHTKLARSLLSASNHPQHWYPFAILAINVTEMLYVFLEKGQLKNQFYNTADQCSLDDFYKLFCFTFHSFHEYWMKTVRDVMFFNFHREQFRSRLESRLQSSDCRLGLTGSNGDVSFFEP